MPCVCGSRAPITAWGEEARPAGSSTLAGRLQTLDGLVARGVLSRTEADDLKVCVLAAAEETWLARLSEAADLSAKGLINESEAAQLKRSLISQLRASAAVA